MTLVGKTGGVGDFAERRVGRPNLPRSEFAAQPPDVFAHRAVKFPAERAGKMNRVNAGDFDDIF